MFNTPTLFKSQLKNLPLIKRGKVRDIYEINEELMLIIATDRLSAFDVILPTPITSKGMILTQLSNFWFHFTRKQISNHLTDFQLEDVLSDKWTEDFSLDADYWQIHGRSVIVKKVKPLPIEAIVRGYLAGSGWKDYQQSGTLCGIHLPPGLQLAEKLPTPIYTPSTKADVGHHDENIDFTRTCELIGQELAEQVREISLDIYQKAHQYAAERGIIIADTKFEFGLDEDGQLLLIDEILTPDSSRFWPKEFYQIGISPKSFDKQFVRDYLETLNWNKISPGPSLPLEIVDKTIEKYQEALRRLIV